MKSRTSGAIRTVWVLFTLGLVLIQLLGAKTPIRPVAGAVVARSGDNDCVNKISPALQMAMSEGTETMFLVILAEQADLTRVAALPTKEARGRAVFTALRDVALRTQAPLRAELDLMGVEYRSFYIVNMLAVKGDAHLIQALAARPGVDRLEANPTIRSILPISEPLADMNSAAVAGVEWGVKDIRADAVWDLGYTGQGIVVAGQDTGYDWDHPALKAQYRGWDGATAYHDYNWHDAIHQDDPHTIPGNPCGFDSPEPCDDQSHGTHTMGTIVGYDGGTNQIGVAPGAQWIGCRNMEQGWGTPATYAECFEFFLAPYPIDGSAMMDGDPSRAPHVINNSWTCPPSEGCDVASLRSIIENVRAAGIEVVVSAGNSGYTCGTVNSPPALHDAAFTVGATAENDQIAGFSSRGPVIVDGSNRPKPDVSAPGVYVRSSVPGGGYDYKSGTSMAAPHVVGLLALLWSSESHLIGNLDATERLVQETARPVIDPSCGGGIDGYPNNTYGWGIVDALAAIGGNTAGLAISAQFAPRWVDPAAVITYTFTVSNTNVLSPATGVAVSDTLPLSTTFAWASGDYVFSGDQVSWALDTISPSQQISTSLAVMVESDLPSGAFIVNADYMVYSSEVLTPVRGVPVQVLIPWRLFAPITNISHVRR